MLELLILLGTLAVAWKIIFRKKKHVNLLGKSVVIVGASSGLGRSMALEYVRRGAQVVLLARRERELQKVQAECISIASFGESRSSAASSISSENDEFVHVESHSYSQWHDIASYRVCDITNEGDIKQSVDLLVSHSRKVDILVLCSGVINVSRFDEIINNDDFKPDQPSNTFKVIDSMFKTNVYGFMLLMKHFLPLLISQKAKVMVISSLGGVVPAPQRSIYCATKHALQGFFNSLRIELEQHGISICIGLPATIDTPIREKAVDNPSNIQKHDHKKQSKGKMLSPDYCAAILIDSLNNNVRQVYIPSISRYIHILSTVFPYIIDQLAVLKYKWQAK